MPRGRAPKTLALFDHIERLLHAENPQSVRQVFYRCLDDAVPDMARVPKNDAGYRRVQRAILTMRREGILPYDYIEDFSRTAYVANMFDNAAEFLARVKGLYRQDMWSGTDYRVEVWCESRGIASTLTDLCKELGVNLYPTGGQASESFLYAAATLANDYPDKTLVVLYIGDYDDAGINIGEVCRDKLARFTHGDMLFERLAVLDWQRDAYHLPTKPARGRSKITQTIEAESIPAGILRQIVTDGIEAYLPSDALATAKIAEQSEKRYIEWAAREIASVY